MITRKFMNESLLKKTYFQVCKSIKYEESQDQCEFIEIIFAFAIFKKFISH